MPRDRVSPARDSKRITCILNDHYEYYYNGVFKVQDEKFSVMALNSNRFTFILASALFLQTGRRADE